MAQAVPGGISQQTESQTAFQNSTEAVDEEHTATSKLNLYANLPAYRRTNAIFLDNPSELRSEQICTNRAPQAEIVLSAERGYRLI